VADGWLGNAFIPEAAEVFLGPLGEGARRAGRALGELDLVAPVAVEFHDDEASADAATRRHADGYAFTIGAMGARGRNFYNDAFTRLGYGAEVGKVAQFWQAGKQGEARAVVQIDLGRLTNLVGTAEWIADRVRRYREIGITTLLAKLEGDYDDQLTALGRLADIIGATAES
jgi:alkanesulfonate monooxygenase SsuD/methylene tetrahydromethanopterin reductase-like flavin-dependent oxidoreductase (luciferase family)